MYAMNGSNACRNCLDLNCSIVISAKFNVILTVKISLLPCYDGNLNIPIHAIDVHILDASGEQIFGKESTQSFAENFEVKVFGFSVPVEVLAKIDNRGDGIFVQVSKSGNNFRDSGFNSCQAIVIFTENFITVIALCAH